VELYFWICVLVLVIMLNVFLANYKHKLDLELFKLNQKSDVIEKENRAILRNIEQYERYIANFKAK